jgi:hypothetical protein
MTPVPVGHGALNWEQTLAAVQEMLGERVTVNVLSDRTGAGVVWLNGTLTRVSEFGSEVRRDFPDYEPFPGQGDLFLLRVETGDQTTNGSGLMLRQGEFETAGWLMPGSRQLLRVQQGGTVIQIMRWGAEDLEALDPAAASPDS